MRASARKVTGPTEPRTWRGAPPRRGAAWRIAWLLLTLGVTQAVVCAAALLPVIALWWVLLLLTAESSVLRLLAVSAAAVPSYALFCLLLMGASGLTIRVLRWGTPAGLETRIADLEPALLDWVRYMVACHLVRLFAGSLFRSSPVWSAYLRLAGARLGRRIYVNSLAVSDYNLLDFGDDVVIGEDVHISGHTVEYGILKTAPVRLGRGVTIGLGSVIDIGVVAGDRCQVGALSVVPKGTRLDAGCTYAGIPAQRIRPPAPPPALVTRQPA